jgi:all-trans-retinol 13,14-reductase
MYDAVVVGSGVSGLTNALLLARAGQRVAVVERAKQCAPLLRGFERWGIQFDTGFHYAGALADGEGLQRFFNLLGLNHHLKIEPMRSSGFDRIITGEEGSDYDFPVGADEIVRTLSDRFPAERAAIRRFIDDTLQVSDHLPYINPDTAIDQLSAFDCAHDVSLTDYLAGLTANPMLRRLLSLHCLLHGIAPERVPFRFHASVIGPYFRSASTIVGGGLALANAFESCLNEAGIDLICDAEVKQILLSSNESVEGVELSDGTVIHSRTVISTIHPHYTLNCLPDRVFRPIYRKRLSGLDESMSACVLFARCRQPLEVLRGRNLYLLPASATSPPIQQQHQQDGRGPVDEHLLYVTSANATSGSDCGGFMVIAPSAAARFSKWRESRVGQRSDSYNTYKQQICDQMIAQLEQLQPELTAEMDRYQLATPLTLRDYMFSPDGALYGVQHQVGQYPLQAITRIKGLYLSGQALVAPGVMGAMISGFSTCGTILGHDRLVGELKQCHQTIQ